ncbi:MAG TPA: peptidylprolyl isomerase [Sphingomicrobium sp.]|nr:peptidylprolyl isomerase [Sphingomicrobium sp.]
MKSLALPLLAFTLAGAAPETTPEKQIAMNPPVEVVADPANRLTLILSNGGTVVIQMRPDAAPMHVQRIQTLVRQGFYDGTIFHRVIPGFMAQGGDPLGTGQGGSKLPDLEAEFNSLPHFRGTVAAARAQDPNSANSQFYIMFAPKASLDGNYTVFGRVVSGMEAVDAIATGEPPAEPTKIVHAHLGDVTVPPVAGQAPTEAPAMEGAPAG